MGERIASVESGRVPAEQMTVPGAATFLEELRRRDVTLYLASGTDLKFVKSELAVLGLEHGFTDAEINEAKANVQNRAEVAAKSMPTRKSSDLADLLGALPTRRDRLIIELRFVEGLTQSEIAREIGVSQVQVSRLLRTNLDRMRRAASRRGRGAPVA